MSTKDQIHASRLYGEARLAAELVALDPAYADVLQRLAAVTDDPTERARVAGEMAGDLFAQMHEGGSDLGYRLLAAGLVLTCGAVDHDAIGPAVQEAYEQGLHQESQKDSPQT